VRGRPNNSVDRSHRPGIFVPRASHLQLLCTVLFLDNSGSVLWLRPFFGTNTCNIKRRRPPLLSGWGSGREMLWNTTLCILRIIRPRSKPFSNEVSRNRKQASMFEGTDRGKRTYKWRVIQQACTPMLMLHSESCFNDGGSARHASVRGVLNLGKLVQGT